MDSNGNTKILLVGDNSAVMESIADRACESKFDVRLAVGSSGAFAAAAETEYEIMVLNLRDLMDEGLALIESFKLRWPLLQVITLNVSSAVRYSMEGMKLGAYADLTLPIDLTDLFEKIADARRHREAVMQAASKTRRTLEDLAVSAAYAESGDFSTALDFLRKLKSKKKGGQKGEL